MTGVGSERSAEPATQLRGIAALWDAQSVAVVGASDRPGSLGNLPVRYLIRYGFQGAVYPVNPRLQEVDGLRCYPSLGAIGEPVDLALVMVAAARVANIIDDCGAVGIPVAIVTASGFAESGSDGAALQEVLVDRAYAAGVRLVGPNCIGAVSFARGLAATFTPLLSSPQVPRLAGGLAFASQSGALGFGAVSLALERGLGLGWAVTTGNEGDVTAVEVLAELAARPDCVGALALLEGVRDGESLRRLAASGKPVAVLKGGTSAAGSAAAASHTGALATPGRVFDCALRQLGIARAEDVEELLDLGEAFAQPRRPEGPRIGIVSTSGGSGILAADAVERHGLELAAFAHETTRQLADVVPAFGSIENPVDVTAAVMAAPTLFADCIRHVADDPTVDVLVACFCVLTDEDVDIIVEGLRNAAEASGKPVLVARTGAEFLAPAARAALRSAGIPVFPTPARAIAAAAGLVQTTRPRPEAAVKTGATAPPTAATELELKRLLAGAGLPIPAGRLAVSAEDAREAVRDLGGTAVLKAVVPGLLHKTELGAVAIGVQVEDAGATWERLRAFGGEVLVEELVEGGVEVLVGIAPSPLGPTLALGLGGIFAEAIGDVTFRLLPVSREEARTMVDDLGGKAVLHGARGRPPSDLDALAELLAGVSELADGWPSDVELDLNPVAVLPAGVRILDAALASQGAH